MKHKFTATWLTTGPADQHAPRVAVAFDRDGTANLLVDGHSGHPVHLTVASGIETFEFNAANIKDADGVAFQSHGQELAATEKSLTAPVVRPLIVLSYLSLAVLAAAGATAAVIGLRSIIQF